MTKTSASKFSCAPASSSIRAANVSAARTFWSSISSRIPNSSRTKSAKKSYTNLAGVIWIDEKAHDVARLEAYFVGDFRFAGGLVANLQKGTSFIFEQAYINNEVWLPTYEEAHVGVRVLLVKGFKVNAVTRYSDYKKFNVESVASINKPKGVEDTPPTKPQNPTDPATEKPNN